MISVDMDGVIADFNASVKRAYGRPFDEHIKFDLFNNLGCITWEIFKTAPPILEGLEMVRKIRAAGIDVCIATSTSGMPGHIHVMKQKADWLSNYGLGDVPVIFCMSTEGKGAFARPGAVLIDDRQKVIDPWVRNGGVGILFERSQADFIASQVIRLELGR